MRAGLVLFTLTMPGIGSWDSKFSGSDKFYGIIRSISKDDIERILDTKSYSYSWDDGWRASIDVEKIDGKDRKIYERKIDGFMGYEWMVDSIIKHNKILSTNDLEDMDYEK